MIELGLQCSDLLIIPSQKGLMMIENNSNGNPYCCANLRDVLGKNDLISGHNT
jgi:hypothetical protein